MGTPTALTIAKTDGYPDIQKHHVVVVVEESLTIKHPKYQITYLYPLVQRAAVDVVAYEQRIREINEYLERSRSPQYRSSRQSRRRVESRTAMIAKSGLESLNGIVIIAGSRRLTSSDRGIEPGSKYQDHNVMRLVHWNEGSRETQRITYRIAVGHGRFVWISAMIHLSADHDSSMVRRPKD